MFWNQRAMGLHLKHVVVAALLCLWLGCSARPAHPAPRRACSECTTKRPPCNSCKTSKCGRNGCDCSCCSCSSSCYDTCGKRKACKTCAVDHPAPEAADTATLTDVPCWEDEHSNENERKGTPAASMKSSYSPDADEGKKQPVEVKQWVVKIDTAQPEPMLKDGQKLANYAVERPSDDGTSSLAAGEGATAKADPQQQGEDSSGAVAGITRKLQGALEALLTKGAGNQGLQQSGSALQSVLQDALSELNHIPGQRNRN